MDTIIEKILGNVYIKRDDLLSQSFGGNKYRISIEYINDMKLKGKNVLIGYGSPTSNLNRTLAFLCYKSNIPCYIVMPTEDDKNYESFNEKLVSLSANIIYCKKNNVSDTIENLYNELEKKGLKPYYINGNKYGVGNEKTPLAAYFKVYNELKTYDFDYIFLPTGTGMTQSGLICGQILGGGREKIIGISIARESKKEKEIITNNINCYFDKVMNYENIYVIDDYLCGGYGKYNINIEKTIESIYLNNGIPLDPIYTGKAFNGMLDYINKNNLQDKKCLFIHTGGTPLFFDYISKKKTDYKIEKINDLKQLVEFIENNEKSLVVPLSVRLNITDYCEKVLKNGNAYCIIKYGEIASIILFYNNDLVTKTSYVSLLITNSRYYGKGYASILMDFFEKESLKAGMKFMALDVSKTNFKAISLYSKKGYQIDGVYDKYHMIKEI